MILKKATLGIVALSFIMTSCANKPTNQDVVPENVYTKISPDFNSDSAYTYVSKQVEFGPRVPNTKEHTECGDFLVGELKRFGADVLEQKMDVKAFDGTVLKARNIIGSYSPEKKDRILLFAHWDTRPFADHDPDPKNHHTPVLGANDAASGVGVLLEVARVIQQKQPELGVDIIFFDVEDYGAPAFEENLSGGWCLGSEYWAKNPHVPGYTARFGILLDMVGAPDANFIKEGYSVKYAGGIVEKIWNTARDLNFGKYFVGKVGGYITDDHVAINEVRFIPSVDIIHYDSETNSGFGSYWHTVKDDMSNVSKETLNAVGQTILEVVYKEK